MAEDPMAEAMERMEGVVSQLVEQVSMLQQRVELLRVLPLDLTKLTARGLRRGGNAGVSRAWRDEAAKEGAPGARRRSAPSRGA